MFVNTENGSAQGQTTVLEKESVYASLFDKINLTPATSLGDINAFLDDAALSDASAGERLTAAMQVFMDCIRKSGQPVEKLDKTLIDHHIAELDLFRCRTTRTATTPASSRRTRHRNQRCTTPPTPLPTAASTPVCRISSCCRASRIT